MELHQLRYVSCIARCGSLSKAAEELYVSRQAISKAVRSLEQELGGELFDRDQSMKLTPLGEKILKHADRIMQDLNDLDLDIHSSDTNSTDQNSISVALTSFPLDYLYFNEENEVISLLNEFKERTQGCTITKFRLFDTSILNAVSDGTIDVGFVHGTYEKEGLKFFPLFPVEMRVIIQKDNPLAQKSTIRIRELENVPVRSPFDLDCFTRNFINQCKKEGFEPQFHEVPINDESIYAFAKEGGVHIQPFDPRMQEEYPENTYVSFHANDRSDLPLCLVYKESTLKPQVKKLVDFFKGKAGHK